MYKPLLFGYSPYGHRIIKEDGKTNLERQRRQSKIIQEINSGIGRERKNRFETEEEVGI